MKRLQVGSINAKLTAASNSGKIVAAWQGKWGRSLPRPCREVLVLIVERESREEAIREVIWQMLLERDHVVNRLRRAVPEREYR
ncbi:MAG TPA: hypothetical protein VMW83_17060 [Spirochaetia bacterium]|nr:hypothetical protein [Spirochaetia bacterium]